MPFMSQYEFYVFTSITMYISYIMYYVQDVSVVESPYKEVIDSPSVKRKSLKIPKG